MTNGEGGLEKKVNATTPKGGGESIFDSIGSSINDLIGAVKAAPGAVKKTAQYTYYSAKAAAGLVAGAAMVGYYGAAQAGLSGLALLKGILLKGYSAFILPVGMAIGTWLANLKNKTETTYKQIANELAVGGLLGGFLHHIFLGSRYLISTAKSAYGTTAGFLTGVGCAIAQMPPFLATHEYLNRALIKDYKSKSLKDIGKQIKKMWPIIPPMLANFTVIPEYLGPAYQMPTAAGVSVAYGLLKGDKKKEEKKEKAPETYKLPKPYALPKAA